MSGLRLIDEIGEEETPLPVAKGPTPEQAKENALAVGLLLTALKALSMRTVIALAALQVTLAIGSVLFLAYTELTLPAPSVIQLVGLAVYAAFVLIALWLSKKR